MTRQSGFTLVELLIALLLFGLLSAAMTALLSFSVDAQARGRQRLDDQAALLRTRSLLAADLAQAAPRPWRDEGGTVQPALLVAGNGALVLVRRGWRNEDGRPRASLQRVGWRLVDGRLERSAAAMIDGAPLGTPAVLMTGIDRLTLRFAARGGWAADWRPSRPGELPDGVEIGLEGKTVGAIRQVLPIGVAL